MGFRVWGPLPLPFRQRLESIGPPTGPAKASQTVASLLSGNAFVLRLEEYIGSSFMKKPTPLGPSKGPRYSPTVRSNEGAVSYERGTPVGFPFQGAGFDHLASLSWAMLLVCLQEGRVF